MNCKVMYEDEDIIVILKPAGFPTQTARIGESDCVSELKNYLAGAKEPYVGVTHRLDQPVEGILVFAKNKKAAASLSAQSASKEMDKRYLALTEGVTEPAAGKIENYLKRDGRTNMSRITRPDEPGAKRAVLEYKTLKVSRDGSEALLEIRLETGRHHQIRVQMAGAGHPLLGDRKYGKEPGYTRGPLALCAYKLGFHHPRDGKWRQYETEPSWLAAYWPGSVKDIGKE